MKRNCVDSNYRPSFHMRHASSQPPRDISDPIRAYRHGRRAYTPIDFPAEPNTSFTKE